MTEPPASLPSLETILRRIVATGTLKPNNETGDALKAFTEFVYSEVGPEQQAALPSWLVSQPAPGWLANFLHAEAPSSSPPGSYLEAIQRMSILSEIELEKQQAASLLRAGPADVARALAAAGLPELDTIGSQDRKTAYDMRTCAFKAMTTGYPYHWADPRVDAEMLLLDRIAPDGIGGTKHVLVVGPATIPFSAFYHYAKLAAKSASPVITVVDSQPGSAAQARQCVRHMEALGIVPKGVIRVGDSLEAALEKGFDPPVDYALLQASQPDKLGVAQKMSVAGVPTIMALNSSGLAELMYPAIDAGALSLLRPLKAAAIPGHADIGTFRASHPVPCLLPEAEPGRKFWVTPLLFSQHPWQDKVHPRIAPLPRAADAYHHDREESRWGEGRC